MVIELAVSLAEFLAPFLPFLVRAGSAAAEEAGKRLSTEGWNAARSVWSRLRPRLDDRTVAEAETAPDVLAAAIARLLRDDPALADDLLDLAQRTPAITVSGHHNTVQQGRYNVQMNQGTDIQFGDR